MWSSKEWKAPFVFVLLVLLGVPARAQSGCADGNPDSVPIDDDSDWWSVSNSSPFEPIALMSPVEKDVAPGTSQIAGVSLRDDFDDIAAKLGKTPMIDRPFRNQICYTSAESTQKVYLVFEVSEIDTSFYLFSGGPTWSGNNLCHQNKQISTDLTTDSGLRLGLSERQVRGILGEPDGVRGKTLTYSRKVWRPRSPEDFERLRKDQPELSDQQAHAQFDMVEVDIHIHARFADSKLTYLGVSESWE
jgi:hypothetical protein